MLGVSGLHGGAGDAGGLLRDGAVELKQGDVGEDSVQKIQGGHKGGGKRRYF